jgi:hypothetical protein
VHELYLDIVLKALPEHSS